LYEKDHREKLKEDIQLRIDAEWTQDGLNSNLEYFEPFKHRLRLGTRLYVKKQIRY